MKELKTSIIIFLSCEVCLVPIDDFLKIVQTLFNTCMFAYQYLLSKLQSYFKNSKGFDNLS